MRSLHFPVVPTGFNRSDPQWGGQHRFHLLSSALETDLNRGTYRGVMNILTGISRWLPLALCVSMAAVLLAGCGSETPATSAPTALPTSAPTALPTSTLTAPGTSAETQPPTAAPTTVSPPEPTSLPTQAPVDVGHQPGQKAPDFALTTVDGEQVTLVSLQGQPVVLYFYATW